MKKRLTALLLALVLMLCMTTQAFAKQGPFQLQLWNLDDMPFETVYESSYGRAVATWFAILEMLVAGVDVSDMDLSKDSYVGYTNVSLDIFIPTSSGYLNPVIYYDGEFSVYEFSYSSERIREQYPDYQLNSLSDLLKAGEVVQEAIGDK